MVGHGGSSAGSNLADPTSPIPSHCASIVVTSTVRVNRIIHSCEPNNDEQENQQHPHKPSNINDIKRHGPDKQNI